MNSKKKLLIQKKMLFVLRFLTNFILILLLVYSAILGIDASLEPNPDNLLKIILLGFTPPIGLLILLNSILYDVNKRIINKLDWVLIAEKKNLH